MEDAEWERERESVCVCGMMMMIMTWTSFMPSCGIASSFSDVVNVGIMHGRPCRMLGSEKLGGFPGTHAFESSHALDKPVDAKSRD